MIVAALIAVGVPFKSLRLLISPAFFGATTKPKARCAGDVCVVVTTIVCGTPVAFCVKTFIKSPKCPSRRPARMAAPISNALLKGTVFTARPSFAKSPSSTATSSTMESAAGSTPSVRFSAAAHRAVIDMAARAAQRFNFI